MMQRAKATALAVSLTLSVAAVGGVVASNQAVAASTLVTTASVNLRSGPGTSYPVLSVVPGGATVSGPDIIDGYWIPVTYNGVRGYIFHTYLTEKASAPAQTGTAVTTEELNVRTGPGTGYSVVGVVAKGVSVTLTGNTSGSWSEIVYGGTARWVHAGYLTTATAPATPAPTGALTTTAELNVRTGPGTSYAVVGMTTVNQQVLPTGVTSGNWTQITWEGALRWVSTSYLRAGTPAASVPQVIGQLRTIDELNVRTEGYFGAPVIGVVPPASLVDVTGKTTASYTQIVFNGRLGWVATSYLRPLDQGPAVQQPATAQAQLVVDYAYSKIGSPYRVGTAGPDYFDCAGLIKAAYAAAGKEIPHALSSQYAMGTPVAKADLRPGDVIFWHSPVTAVSLYVGNGMMISAEGEEYGVALLSVDKKDSWAYFAGARRYLS